MSDTRDRYTMYRISVNVSDIPNYHLDTHITLKRERHELGEKTKGDFRGRGRRTPSVRVSCAGLCGINLFQIIGERERERNDSPHETAI